MRLPERLYEDYSAVLRDGNVARQLLNSAEKAALDQKLWERAGDAENAATIDEILDLIRQGGSVLYRPEKEWEPTTTELMQTGGRSVDKNLRWCLVEDARALARAESGE